MNNMFKVVEIATRYGIVIKSDDRGNISLSYQIPTFDEISNIVFVINKMFDIYYMLSGGVEMSLPYLKTIDREIIMSFSEDKVKGE